MYLQVVDSKKSNHKQINTMTNRPFQEFTAATIDFLIICTQVILYKFCHYFFGKTLFNKWIMETFDSRENQSASLGFSGFTSHKNFFKNYVRVTNLTNVYCFNSMLIPVCWYKLTKSSCSSLNRKQHHLSANNRISLGC